MVDDMRWMYALCMIWLTSYILQGGHGGPWVEINLMNGPSICKTGFQDQYDRLSINVCIHHQWYPVKPDYFCFTMMKRYPNESEWTPVRGCQVCEGHYCDKGQVYICYCLTNYGREKWHLHNNFAHAIYSGMIWRAQFAWGPSEKDVSLVYSSEIQLPTIYPLKWANFSVNGVRLSMEKCVKAFLNIGSMTFKFCAMGLVRPLVSMTLDILEPTESEDAMCITRTTLVTENRHMQTHLHYSEQHDECNIQKSYYCDVYFVDCTFKVENPVSLTVDGNSLLSTPVCEMKLPIGHKHVIHFCRDELDNAVLQVMKNNIWTNSTQHCIHVKLTVDAVNSVSIIFQYTDLCSRSGVHTCVFKGYAPTSPPVTEAPNTTCFDCEKEVVTTPCYYCDEDVTDSQSYLLPVIISFALLLIIGSIACYLRIKRKCCWKKDRDHQPDTQSRSDFKFSEKKSDYEYDSSEMSTSSSMVSEDEKSTYG